MEFDQQAVDEVVLGDKQGPVNELYTNQKIDIRATNLFLK